MCRAIIKDTVWLSSYGALMNSKGQRLPLNRPKYCQAVHFLPSSLKMQILIAGYFCNNCIYLINKNECAIVKDKGPDVNGEESGITSPCALCTLWLPIEGQTQ